MEGNVELKTVGELFNMEFRIPSYQRGYRWRDVHVETLLNDLKIFKEQIFKDDNTKDFYSLQPLVVVKTEGDGREKNTIDISSATTYADAEEILRNAWLKSRTWDVIDGQQRLTTLFLILKYLKQSVRKGTGSDVYTISYETRSLSKDFLKNIEKKTLAERKCNIDYTRMGEVYDAIKKWFEGEDDDYKNKFWDCICENVRFIWYESQGESPIEVFTRLNIGNIKLTDAELVKALLLNRDMFSEEGEQLEFARKKLASEWDEIERRLQDDAFWYYLQPNGSSKKDAPTRIDFILNLTKGRLNIEEGTGLFLSYENYFRKDSTHMSKTVWASVLGVYRMLEEWFDNSELYHYTGYLMAINKCDVVELSKLWKDCEKDGRKEFIDSLLSKIRDSLNEIAGKGGKYEKGKSVEGFLDDLLSLKYRDPRVENQNGDALCRDKTVCRPILLLHNILTVLKIGKGESENSKYRGQKSYYKFPFNLYNNENWDVEHIASQTDNDLSNDRERKEWLLSAWQYIKDEGLKIKIRDFLGEKENRLSFEDLAGLCDNNVSQNGSSAAALSDADDKNMIGNFVLLDAGTNRSYKNALFPVKRRTIMFKEQGIKLVNPELKEGKVVFQEESAQSPFVPHCTKNVFLQYYTKQGASPLFWSKSDAESYRDDIKKLLKEFVFPENDENLEKKLEGVNNEQ